ncbi:MAG: MotA/TolQ/ExbB proton channel family protein [Methylophilales bacterium]|nr:MotA/TolQ/ExbB proton channel family protein [Methylophilales bacterium]
MSEIIQAAGWPIWPLIFTSIIGFAIIIERSFSLRDNLIIPKKLWLDLQTQLKQGTIKKEAIQVLRESSMLGEVLATVLKNHTQPLDVLKDSVQQTGESISFRLEKHLSLLAMISTVAPLLGLFGTIIGMVELFGSFTSSGHDVAVFARGISVALYNTAGGIVVAVPAMIAYRFFRTKVNHQINVMEEHAALLIELTRDERK